MGSPTAISLRDDASGNAVASAGRFQALALELLLVLFVIQRYRLEEQRGLFLLMTLVVGGYFVLRILPACWRLTWFLALSIASFPLILGWENGAWVLGLGMGLLAVCHLPINGWKRGFLVFGLVSCLSFFRSNSTAAFWPVLGSLFLFRLWIYLRSVPKDDRSVPWQQKLSYFFLLPNVCFAFFPIIDYRTFCNAYSPEHRGEVAQRGAYWITQGITHLLLYRLIKAHFLPSPTDLVDIETVLVFLITNYALYLRISGYFHIIIGILHLYGFHLPRTHHHYLLATSPSDIWKRINIYWKNFLTEQVFLPTFFLARRLPATAAMIVAVMTTFFATWILHSWQAFWLLGRFPITTRDAVLWLSAGVLVSCNAIWQLGHIVRKSHNSPLPTSPEGNGNCQSIGSQRPDTASDCSTPRPIAASVRLRGMLAASPALAAFKDSLKIFATLFAVSVFWACWTIPEFPKLVIGLVKTRGMTYEAVLRVASIGILAIATGTLAGWLLHHFHREQRSLSRALERSLLSSLVPLLIIAALSLPAVQKQLPPDASAFLSSLQSEPLGAAEMDRNIMGYYEQLAAVDHQAGPLVSERGVDNEGPHRDYWTATRDRPDLLGSELIPGWSGEVEGCVFQVNRWGIRDDDFSRRKPAGTYRIGMVGSSVTMGYGVDADADFESRLEQQLLTAASQDGLHVEVLNFAVGGYYALQTAEMIRERVLAFDPDAVYYVAHQGEFFGPPRHLSNAFKAGYKLPYDCLSEVIRDAEITDKTPQATADIILQNRAEQIVSCVYRGVVQDCQRHGVTAVWIYLPIPGVSDLEINEDELVRLARDAGFIVIDLRHWAEGLPSDSLKLGSQNYHLNEYGHRVAADRIFESLRQIPQALPGSLASPSRAGTPPGALGTE